MSVVYTVTIQMYDEEEQRHTDDLNVYLTKNKLTGKSHGFKLCDPADVAGTKCAERGLLRGAFNYLDEEAFVAHVRSLNIGGLLITIGDPHGDGYRIYTQDREINVAGEGL